jgi:tRNA threonylcarbamoyladenosine biosynthesis protein TsaB
MNVLAFDTCMTACSVAAIRDMYHMCARFTLMERGHAEALFPMISEVMAELELDFADLTRIAVTRGPGTFTGVRAGIAAARGLALGCGAPIFTATSLEIMALGAYSQLGEDGKDGFLVAHDAKRGELYTQLFDDDCQALSQPALATPAEAAALAADCGVVAGSGAALVAAGAERAGIQIRALYPDLLPDAAHLARAATWRDLSVDPVSPLYLRAPDAKPQMDKHLARI